MKRSRSIRKNALAAVLGTAGVLCASAPGSASAQEANGFGEKGQLILSVDRLMPLLSYSSQSETSTQGGLTVKTSDSGTSAALLFGSEPTLAVVHTLPRIAFDFTIVNHLTVGGSIAAVFGTAVEWYANNPSDRPDYLIGELVNVNGNGTPVRKTDTPSRTVIGFAPRVGYVLPVGRNFAFWPRLGFALYSVSSKSDNVVANAVVTTTNTDTLFSLDLDPQFVWTPIQHFFFNVGPLLNIPLSGSRSVEVEQGPRSDTTKSDLSLFHFGLSAGLGGWFDL